MSRRRRWYPVPGKGRGVCQPRASNRCGAMGPRGPSRATVVRPLVVMLRRRDGTRDGDRRGAGKRRRCRAQGIAPGERKRGQIYFYASFLLPFAPMPRTARIILPNLPHHVMQGEWERIREAIQRGQLTGGNRFVADVARKIGRRVERRGRGRPVNK